MHLSHVRLDAAAFAALALPAVARAQDAAPDGTRAFGIEPYVGVLGGYDSYDRNGAFGARAAQSRMQGYIVSGIAGVNVPLGPVFVGAEGNATKGFDDLNWEYGAKGRVGVRAGNSGLVYISGGYQWVDGKHKRGFGDDHDWLYGVGLEVGPKDLGMPGNNSGIRLRLQADTYNNFQSIRPMAGVVFHL